MFNFLFFPVFSPFPRFSPNLGSTFQSDISQPQSHAPWLPASALLFGFKSEARRAVSGDAPKDSQCGCTAAPGSPPRLWCRDLAGGLAWLPPGSGRAGHAGCSRAFPSGPSAAAASPRTAREPRATWGPRSPGSERLTTRGHVAFGAPAVSKRSSYFCFTRYTQLSGTPCLGQSAELPSVLDLFVLKQGIKAFEKSSLNIVK